MLFIRVLLALVLLVVLLVSSNFFWEIQHRKSFLRSKMWDEPTLRRLVSLANDASRPNGMYGSRLPTGMFATGPPAINMVALLQSDVATTGGVRNLTIAAVIVVGVVAFLVFTWFGLAAALAVFIAFKFVPLSRSGQNSAYERMVQITDALYAWHRRDADGVVAWLNGVPGFQPAYRVLKAEVLDKEAGNV